MPPLLTVRDLAALLAPAGPRDLPLESVVFPPCIYFLFHGDALRYLGKTHSLAVRIREHMQTKTFDRVTWIPCPSRLLHYAETGLIKMLHPPLNKGGFGDRETREQGLISIFEEDAIRALGLGALLKKKEAA